jgi:myosin-5
MAKRASDYNVLAWIPDRKQVYVLAHIISEDLVKKEVTLKTVESKENKVVKKADVVFADASHLGDFDDLCQMNNLHEAALLHMLKRRWETQKIYTNTAGDVLISMNPFKVIPGLYDEPLKYFDIPEENDDDEHDDEDKDLPPHIFDIANNALRAIVINVGDEDKQTSATFKMNQSIIISGESGSGKTEASKFIVNYLIMANDQICARATRAGLPMKDHGDKVRLVLTKGNSIFEAFGNAKTL